MRKKERKGLRRLIAIAIIAAVLGTAVYLVFKIRYLPDTPDILTAGAEKGSIVMSVVSSGNIANGALINEELPVGVKIDKILVEKGDLVDAGDPVIVVNEASIKSKLSSVEEEIRNIDKEINKIKGDTESSNVKSNISGRIKQVFAEQGDDVVSVMLEKGSLAILSVDGKLKVTIENTTLAAADKVDVVLGNSSKIKGTVDTVKNGTSVVTVSDNGPAVGETVVVMSEDGSVLGTGTLEINQPVTIVASNGRIKTVNIGLNGYVSSGAIVFTLEDLPPSAELMDLLIKRNALADTLVVLVGLSKDNVFTASVSGTVNTININNGDTTSKGMTPSSNSDGFSSNFPFNFGFMSSGETGGASASSLGYGTGSRHKTAKSHEIAKLGAVEITEITNGMVLQGLFRILPTTGGTPVTSVETREFTGDIIFTPADSVFKPDSQYVADVSLTAKDGYIFPAGYVPSFGLDISVSNVVITGTGPGNTLTFRLVFPKTLNLDNILSLLPDDILGDLLSGISLDELLSSAMGGFKMPDYSSLLPSTSLGNFGASDSDNENLMSAIVIASNETMVLTVDVDELDILKIQKGQQAVITFDAIPNREFSAVITRISSAAEGNSGVARYSVDLTIDKDSSLRAGMNATARIKIDEKDSIIKIPVDAIQEQVGRSFVYTKYADDKLSEEREIVTGISDGEFVEITEGLAEGESVFYEMKARGFSFYRLYGRG